MFGPIKSYALCRAAGLGVVMGLFGAAACAANLRDETAISERILTVGIADIIRNECPSIRARMLRAVFYVTATERMARKLGYSQAEVDAYVDDDVEKDRLRGIGHARLAEWGAVPGQPETYCTVGRDQIAAKTEIGKLLKAN